MGPDSTGAKAVNVGVAAHIHAAAPGGARYDSSQSHEERRSLENGIWCCRICGTLVDDDKSAYPAAYLKERKRLHEEAVRASLGIPGALVASIHPSGTISGVSRLTRLESLGRASRARCIRRWLAAGVTAEEAEALVEDSSVGSPSPELLPTPDRPLVLWLGELGSGKSLMAERFFEAAVGAAYKDVTAPIPVYLEARNAAGRLRPCVEHEAAGLGELHSQGANITIDGADEAGFTNADSVLSGPGAGGQGWSVG